MLSCKKDPSDVSSELNSRLVGIYHYIDRTGSTCEISDSGVSVISEKVNLLESGQIIWTKNKYLPNSSCTSANLQEVSISKGVWKTLGNEFTFTFTLFSLTPKSDLSVRGRNTNSTCGISNWKINVSENSSTCSENVDLINEPNSNSYDLEGSLLVLNKGASGELTLRKQ